MIRLLSFLFLFFSSSVFSAVCESNYATDYANSLGYSVGMKYDADALASLKGWYVSGSCNVYFKPYPNKSVTFINGVAITEPCQPNPDTAVCEDETPPEPEPCQPGYERNELGLCVPKPEDGFCEEEFPGLEVQEYVACLDQFPNHFVQFSAQCNSRDDYFFSCSQGVERPQDPTKPLPDGGGDFSGGNPGTANPDTPDFDKPEPDPVPPTPETDTALLDAIQNLNRDNNQALIGLNTDLNKGMTDIDNQLSQLNDTNNAIGQAIVDQTTQDRLIHDANKALALQNTGAINQASSAITGAINSGVDRLGAKLDGLGTSLDDLADGSNTSVSGTGCESGTFSCSGNEYECFMARQAYESRCDSLTSTETDAPGLRSELVGLGSDLTETLHAHNQSFDPDALRTSSVDVTSTMNTINETNGVNFQAGCPTPKLYDYGLGSFTIDYQPFCDLAVVIRALLMLAASVASLMLYAKFL